MEFSCRGRSAAGKLAGWTCTPTSSAYPRRWSVSWWTSSSRVAGAAHWRSGSGTVNAIFRIGDQLAARFPLQPGDAGAAAQRIGARGERGPRAGRPHPVPHARAGRAGRAGRRLPAAVVGADLAARRDRHRRGPGRVDRRSPATWPSSSRGARRSTPGPGVPRPRPGRRPARHDDWLETCFERSERLLDVPRLRRMWHAAGAAPGPAAT